MPFRSQDDCFVPKESHFEQNIDYLSPNHISNLHLHLCWRENNSASKKRLHVNTTSAMPSLVSKRLENIAWRRWDKQMWNLGESSPSLINWNKTQDVTWLYGPKYSRTAPFDDDVPLTHENLSRFSGPHQTVPDLEEDDVSSMNSSTRSMSFDDGSSVESVEISEDYDSDDDESFVDLKSALKSHRHPFLKEKPTRKKSVKFNYIVNSREFMNGLSFDYHFLDPSCL